LPLAVSSALWFSLERPFRPSEFSIKLLDQECCHHRSSSGSNFSFRVFGPSKYRPYGLDDPTLPLAVSSALWFSLDGIRRTPFSIQSNPLCELLLPEYYPA
jgi:hypothetical protein